MIVPATALGATRAYMARPTGNTFAKPALLKSSNASTQPKPALWSGEEARAAPTRQSAPTALSARPIVILVISLGSLKRFAHRRQKTTAPTRNDTLTTASSVTSHVVGIVMPKNTMFTWSGTQSMYALK